MNHTRKISVLSMTAAMSFLLMACTGQQESPTSTSSSAPPASSAATSQSSETTAAKEADAGATRSYTDYMGHAVNIPTSPQRVIFAGETFSDVLALGVQAVGSDSGTMKGSVYEDKLTGVEDVGFPINLEKTLNLSPDVILVANTDEAAYQQLAKIAPTLMFDTFAPLEERLPLLGDILGKKEQAKQWVADYQVQEKAMWKALQQAGIKQGETASVFTYYPGDRLFVMAKTGLSQILYQPDGFKPTPKIQEVLQEDVGFKQIPLEALPQFAGDRIFILTPVAKEAQDSTDAMLKSALWQNIPAVKQGHVYTIDILKSGSDALTRQWLLQKLPEIMAK
ncbi:ABC transporter substrate-binding protein [Paenibacillus sp. HJL G12]|uniref:ABC transporter substrate-binding protein n=1 Tax=Paenibacillus dendrobii TaxID=2691084 RepID=A0A7X3ILG8_9BACL|nr:ABC transporter substrate-binding protein [Paenibacillus dendrobii]MWV45688.1 ABC transporter substrate-binding protein [Paenibacillus dendrobii]